MSRLLSALLVSSALTVSVHAEDAGITAFQFDTLATRSATLDRATYVYPDTHDLAGQINANTGDVRLDGIIVDGTTHLQDDLQLVASANIVQDDAVDTERGGGNLTTGFGIGADLDLLVGEGHGSTTPTADDIRDAQANFNLTSLVAVRENVGTAIYEVTFADPTSTLLLWERGNSGDIQVDAIDESGKVVGSLLVLDGSNDGDQPSTYTPTGVFVTTFVQDGFLNQGQELSSVGLTVDQPVRTFRFTALQEPEGDGAIRYNGPDLKILALAPVNT